MLFPVSEIAAFCRRRDVPFHCDAVQAVGKLPVDYLSLSAHKLGGPKGGGALFRAQGRAIEEPTPDAVLGLMERYAPDMDYADACAVLSVKAHKGRWWCRPTTGISRHTGCRSSREG